jgi:hypothetical protein
MVLCFSGPEANEVMAKIKKEEFRNDKGISVPENSKKINRMLGYLFCGRLFSEL